MKVGIILLNSCHSETLLTWIDYCIKKNIIIKFTQNYNYKNDYLSYYKTKKIF